MRHTNCYTFQQEVLGQTFIILMDVSRKSKFWVFWDISGIFRISPEGWCACQIPEVKRYAESWTKSNSYDNVCVSSSISERNALLIHTGLDSIQFFTFPLTKSKCIIFSYLLILLSKGSFCLLQNFFVLPHFSLTEKKNSLHLTEGVKNKHWDQQNYGKDALSPNRLVFLSIIWFDHTDSTILWIYLLSKRISIILESL